MIEGLLWAVTIFVVVMLTTVITLNTYDLVCPIIKKKWQK